MLTKSLRRQRERLRVSRSASARGRRVVVTTRAISTTESDTSHRRGTEVLRGLSVRVALRQGLPHTHVLEDALEERDLDPLLDAGGGARTHEHLDEGGREGRRHRLEQLPVLRVQRLRRRGRGLRGRRPTGLCRPTGLHRVTGPRRVTRLRRVAGLRRVPGPHRSRGRRGRSGRGNAVRLCAGRRCTRPAWADERERRLCGAHGSTSRCPGRMRFASAPMTSRFASLSSWTPAAISAGSAPGSRSALIRQRLSPATTTC